MHLDCDAGSATPGYGCEVPSVISMSGRPYRLLQQQRTSSARNGFGETSGGGAVRIWKPAPTRVRAASVKRGPRPERLGVSKSSRRCSRHGPQIDSDWNRSATKNAYVSSDARVAGRDVRVARHRVTDVAIAREVRVLACVRTGTSLELDARP